MPRPTMTDSAGHGIPRIMQLYSRFFSLFRFSFIFAFRTRDPLPLNVVIALLINVAFHPSAIEQLQLQNSHSPDVLSDLMIVSVNTKNTKQNLAAFCVQQCRAQPAHCAICSIAAPPSRALIRVSQREQPRKAASKHKTHKNKFHIQHRHVSIQRQIVGLIKQPRWRVARAEAHMMLSEIPELARPCQNPRPNSLTRSHHFF
ncbi:hypothetical protein BZA70DRAFT_157893 [Myxozyma melibiosi]|uniref:Uncharacterized protein n=1 Tax=Myxozyma melibiosi TaxID=54550 RepID=A0ABR1F6H0_9ASCO